MSAYPGPAAVSAAAEILEAAGYHPHKSTIINALRSADSAAAFDRREDEPARPVEDREPVGPYAPTRDLPREASVNIAPNVEWLAERFDRIDTRLDGLVDVVLRQETRLTEHLRLISTKVDFLNQVDESEGGELLITQGFANAQYDKGVNDGMASGKMIGAAEAFERGRQQGDADRAQRGQTEYERGRLSGLIEGKNEGEDKLIEARGIARAAVEAELLDQGWTPPGVPTSVAILGETGPTDYEVWRDALTLAAQCDPPDCEDPGDLINKRGPGSRYYQINADAEWFWELLQQVPTISPDEAKTSTMRTVVDGQDDTWCEVGPDQWLVGPVGTSYSPEYLDDNARTLEYIEQMYGLKAV